MSSTNKTANYNLSQFVGTDIPNPLTDYNGDMEKIDVAISAVATTAGEAKEASDTAVELVGEGHLDTDAQTLIGAINELKGVDDSLKSRVSTAETGINSLNNSLATTNQALTNATNRVTSLEDSVGNTPLDTVAQTITGAINELKATDVSLDARVTVLEESGGGGGGGIVDTEMSATSRNAVENRVIKAYVDGGIGEVVRLVREIEAQATGETHSGLIPTGATYVDIPFNMNITSASYITVFTDTFGVNPTDVTYTTNNVRVTIDTQPSDVNISVMIFDRS